MVTVSPKLMLWVAVGIAAVILLKKNGINLVQGAGAAVVEAAADVATGAVIGIGNVVGIPATNESECQKAIREGRTWDASFACDAATWLKSLTGSGA